MTHDSELDWNLDHRLAQDDPMTQPRCDLTELLTDQCGCRNHRGGTTPDEDIAAHHAQMLAHPAWFAAQYPGMCERCGTPFQPGAAIRMDPGVGWRAECCP
jgi:hypothetical protein